MTEPGGQPDKMAEVAVLAAAIADRILDQHEAGVPIPPEQFRMLVRAARMLLDNGVLWPSSVEYVVMEVAKRVDAIRGAASGQAAALSGDDVVMHLTQALDTRKRS